MGRKKRYTAADIIGALRKTHGMVYLAANELDCSHTTVYNYMKKHPSVKAEFDRMRGELLDNAEQKLRDAILAGEHWAVAFALKTIGKHRGYVEKQAVDLKTDGELRVVYIDDWRDKASHPASGPADSDARPGPIQVVRGGATVAQDDDGDEYSD